MNETTFLALNGLPGNPVGCMGGFVPAAAVNGSTRGGATSRDQSLTGQVGHAGRIDSGGQSAGDGEVRRDGGGLPHSAPEKVMTEWGCNRALGILQGPYLVPRENDFFAFL